MQLLTSYVLAQIWLSIFKRFEKYTIGFYEKSKLSRLNRSFQSILYETNSPICYAIYFHFFFFSFNFIVK